MKRDFQGVILVGGSGNWKTEDGLFEIAVQEYETECDGPHPLRNAPKVKDWKGDWITSDSKYCEGSQPHFYNQWHVWDLTKDDTVKCSGRWDTMGQAVSDLKAHLEGRCNCQKEMK